MWLVVRWSESSRWLRRTIPISSTLGQSECKIFPNSHFPFSLCLQSCYLQWKKHFRSSSAGLSFHYNRVDVAFICMCAFAIDELFSDDWSRWKTIKHFGQKFCQACQFRLKCQTFTKKTMSTPTLFHAKWMWFSILICQYWKI